MIKIIKMKHYLVIGLVFLMVGCETIEANLPPAVTKTQVDDHWPMDLMVQIPNNKLKNLVQTAKPILCADKGDIFSYLENIGEMPVATWTDETQGYPVILFMNTKTGGSSVIEIPSLDKGPFRGLVCFISTGVNSAIESLTKKDIGKSIKYLTF